MELVHTSDGGYEWRPRKIATSLATVAKPSEIISKLTAAGPEPVVVDSPVKVLVTPGITITEYFGNVATNDGTASFAVANVHRKVDPWEVAWQTPRFAEYVIVDSGSLTLHTVHKDGCQVTQTHVAAGQGVFLPAGLRVKWSWPEVCTYTVVCVPAFSTFNTGNESGSVHERNALVNKAARTQLSQMHLKAGMAGPRYLPEVRLRELPEGVTPLVVSPIAVVP